MMSDSKDEKPWMPDEEVQAYLKGKAGQNVYTVVDGNCLYAAG
jgi:hypothetical protein